MTDEITNNHSFTHEGKITQTILEMELSPVIFDDKVDPESYTKIPLTKLSTLGIGLDTLAPAFQSANPLTNTAEMLYKVTIPKGTHLAKFKDGSGYLGGVFNAKNNLVGQARLTPVGQNPMTPVVQTPMNPVVLNPTMVLIAVALAGIEKKLDAIQEMQQEIMNFLVQKEKSELRGDLNFLLDVFNNYKYNWNNEKYKNSNYIKVLDIKQAAERKIDFYSVQTKSIIQKKLFLHLDQDVKSKLAKAQGLLRDFMLSLYLYSFSSFLEVILLENYDSAYLSRIIAKIEGYQEQYRELHTFCTEQISGDAKASIQSHVVKGLSSASMFSGKLIAKVPVISKSQIDENLIAAGEKLEDYSEKRNEKTKQQFLDEESSFVLPFIDNIKLIDKTYNEPVELLFDRENLYIETAAA